MNEMTKMSSRGQVVIPKAVRDRHGWGDGTPFDVVDTPQGVLLRPRASNKKSLSVDEALARIRSRVTYCGPPVTIEEMNETISEMWKQSAIKSDC
jgi:AbrB family looped-hinge helix DNA binding protein